MSNIREFQKPMTETQVILATFDQVEELQKQVIYLESLLAESVQPFAFTKDPTLFTRINAALAEEE